MGYGNYSHAAHVAISNARADSPREAVFKQTRCHPAMNPLGVGLRESRDSAAHPNSLAVVFALDVTGSMGAIPELLARRHLPTFMQTVLDAGIADPQILFLAVGDATCDQAPLQVGQFESAAREMDQWLTWSFLEGGGGGQNTESYELALYFAARHTATDCWTKRRHRGYLFMTGDELPYPVVSRQQVTRLIGRETDEDIPVRDLVAEVQKTFDPFFFIPDPARAPRCETPWRDLLGDHVVCLEDPADTCLVAAAIMALQEGAVADLDALAARLRASGETKARAGAVVRAVTPFAAALGRDATPTPAHDPPVMPSGDGDSYRQY